MEVQLQLFHRPVCEHTNVLTSQSRFTQEDSVTKAARSLKHYKRHTPDPENHRPTTTDPAFIAMAQSPKVVQNLTFQNKTLSCEVKSFS